MKLFALLFLLISCGSSHEHSGDPPAPVYQQPPTGGDADDTDNPPTAGGKPSYAEVNALLVTYCDSCHSGARFRGSESALRDPDASVLQRVRARTMPPRGAKPLPEKERGLILSFF